MRYRLSLARQWLIGNARYWLLDDLLVDHLGSWVSFRDHFLKTRQVEVGLFVHGLHHTIFEAFHHSLIAFHLLSHFFFENGREHSQQFLFLLSLLFLVT